jgi:hypothetical protein
MEINYLIYNRGYKLNVSRFVNNTRRRLGGGIRWDISASEARLYMLVSETYASVPEPTGDCWVRET